MKKNMLFILVSLFAVLTFGTAGAFQETSVIGMPNPWTETDPDGLMQTLGLQFDVPEGAENIVYRMLTEEKLAEMQFTLNDMPFTARIKPAGVELEDISGLNYDWAYVEQAKREFARHWYREEHRKALDDGKTVEVFLWLDIVPGLTCSLSTEAADLNDFDISAVAEQVYHPVQGNN